MWWRVVVDWRVMPMLLFCGFLGMSLVCPVIVCCFTGIDLVLPWFFLGFALYFPGIALVITLYCPGNALELPW